MCAALERTYSDADGMLILRGFAVGVRMTYAIEHLAARMSLRCPRAGINKRREEIDHRFGQVDFLTGRIM